MIRADGNGGSCSYHKGLIMSISGSVVVEWDEKDPRIMRLVHGLCFTDKHWKIWSVRKNSIIDGASIPRILWSVVGSPFVGRYRRASVFHDVYCEKKTESCFETHRMFLELMLEDGVSKYKAYKLYFAVLLFGPKWK